MKERILIVDDDEHVRHILKLFVTREGYEVEEARTGMQAIQILEQDSLSLVLLDIVLPDMDGLDVLRTTKRRDPDIIVIMLTGMCQEEVWGKAMKAGATDYMTKPFTYEQLHANLSFYLMPHSKG